MRVCGPLGPVAKGAGSYLGGTMAKLTLRDLCTPRQTTFSRDRAETVAEINDLGKLDAKQFFDESPVTEGMATLLRQVFQRLTGQNDQGVYRLKQAMGGGKTHNLLAAALLARDAGLRKSILGRLGMSVDGRAIRLSAFSGRETDMRDYLWVRIFRDLGRESQWMPTIEEPGPSTWAPLARRHRCGLRGP